MIGLVKLKAEFKDAVHYLFLYQLTEMPFQLMIEKESLYSFCLLMMIAII